MATVRLPRFISARQPATAPTPPKATPNAAEVPTVTVDPAEERWPDFFPPGEVVAAVDGSVAALNGADEETLRSLIPARSARLGASQEPGVFYGFTMPSSQDEGGDYRTVDEVIRYATELNESRRVIQLRTLRLSLDPARSDLDASEPLAWVNMTFLGQLLAPDEDPLGLSGKGLVQWGERPVVAVWRVAPLPPGVQPLG
jgi:Arc/MetJ-type ribon-helix-helix transcriptional regulator